MTRPYAPRSFLRHVPVTLLRQFFEQYRIDLALDWETNPTVNTIYDAWVTHHPQQREQAEYVFRQVHDLASTEGTRILIEEGLIVGQDYALELDAVAGFQAKGLWVHLRCPRAFHSASQLHRASLLPSRYWRRRTGLPRIQPDLSHEAMTAFRTALAEYFRREQGRGHRCTTDPYDRGERGVFVFAYPDDYTQAYVGHDTHGRLARVPQRPAFEVVFSFHPNSGVLDLYATGERRVKDALEDLFCEHLLDGATPAELPTRHPFELNELKSCRSGFPTDPTDGVTEVRVRRLRLSIPGENRRIVLEANPNGPCDDIYTMLETAVNRENYPLWSLCITQATFVIRYQRPGDPEPRAMEFEVTHPNGCNLKSKPDDERELGERCLARWGISRE